MTASEKETILIIKGMIWELPEAKRQECEQVAQHLRRIIESAGEPVGTLALALVGAEAQAKAT